MQLHIRLFANLREFFGQDSLSIDAPSGITAGDLPAFILAAYPHAQQALTNVLVARNQAIAMASMPLTEDDELAFIPPVGGGETETFDDGLLRLSDEPLHVEAAYHLLEHANHGGTTLFVGTVREWTADRQTSHLSYEAYAAMAKVQMQQIQADVEKRFPGVTTLQWHRIGLLYPTDIAVICGASCAHRDDSFQAARMLIERLKKEVSIWKKEAYVDGNTKWQANQP